jgi:hypothetical protein
MDYEKKYLKYKQKYLLLKSQIEGGAFDKSTVEDLLEQVDMNKNHPKRPRIFDYILNTNTYKELYYEKVMSKDELENLKDRSPDRAREEFQSLAHNPLRYYKHLIEMEKTCGVLDRNCKWRIAHEKFKDFIKDLFR